MPRVNVLPGDVISRIAAGEVIERPASIVKELVENSLDADTKSVDVIIKEAGKSLVHVRDTGTGIDRADMEKIFTRHATSKIQRLDDLYGIASLGFRGEALYSIGSIADVVLRSKTGSQDTGWEIHVRGGERLSHKPVNMPVGTEIEVKEIFFNTPARRKFMKTDTAELNQILSTFIPYTMICPGLRFRLIHYGKTLIDLAPSATHAGRIARALHLKKEHIIETYKKSDEGDLVVRLFLGDINIQRARKDMQFIFVNSRPVNDRTMNFHLNQIYRLIFPRDVFPFFAAFIDVPRDMVDVNTHPAKREVRIKDERRLVYLIRPLAEHALMSLGLPKKADETWDGSPVASGKEARPAASVEAGIHGGTPSPRMGRDAEPRARQYILFKDGAAGTASQAELSVREGSLRDRLFTARYMGAFMNKYILFEAGTSILFMDQHAAQERINYEKYRGQIEKGRIEVQRLLTPNVIRLTQQEMNVWEGMRGRLDELGLETTQWDREAIALHAHPQLITRPEISIRNILADNETARYDKEALARRACRSSVMAGDSLSRDAAEHVRASLLACVDPFTCPHGRPTVVEIDEKFLKRHFLRV